MSYSGLTDAEVLHNRQQYGSNKLPEKKLRSWFSFFMETFQDKINIILLGMMVVFTIMAIFHQGTFAEPFGVALVLVIIAILNTSTGLRSQKSTKELKDRTSVRYCNVIRNGNTKQINTDELVVGDIVLLESGEAIYADGYLISGTIKVDNSVLNGESEDCRKNAWSGEVPPYDAATRVPEGKDYVDEYSLFAGAMITEGEGKMIVTNVGIGQGDYPGTVNGKTITSIDEIEETKTSLDIQLDELADQISKFGYIGALIIVIALLVTNILSAGGIGNYVDQGWINVLKNVLTIAATALTIIVAAVPEGLPLIVSLITAQNAKTMIKHNVLAKNTNKIPEAGNIQLLCTDKTGTLTKGKLVPVSVVDGSGVEIDKDSELYSLFKLGTALNATATFDENGSVVGGNATERALMSLLTAEEYKDIVANAPVTNKKPFNSAYKYSAVETNGEKGVITYYKGAPERLLAKAKYCMTAEGKQELDSDRVTEEIITPFTSRAMRVIATGYSEQALSDEIPDDLTIISLVAIRDDVREEVPAAVQKMHEAGVQVMMITGDVLETAKAIAQDAGLLDDPENDICMSAETFDSLSDEDATEKLPHIKVIARATPNTKLRVVQLAQELKLCVGMTGKYIAPLYGNV